MGSEGKERTRGRSQRPARHRLDGQCHGLSARQGWDGQTAGQRRLPAAGNCVGPVLHRLSDAGAYYRLALRHRNAPAPALRRATRARDIRHGGDRLFLLGRAVRSPGNHDGHLFPILHLQPEAGDRGSSRRHAGPFGPRRSDPALLCRALRMGSAQAE